MKKISKDKNFKLLISLFSVILLVIFVYGIFVSVNPTNLTGKAYSDDLACSTNSDCIGDEICYESECLINLNQDTKQFIMDNGVCIELSLDNVNDIGEETESYDLNYKLCDEFGCETSDDCTEGICYKTGNEPGECISTNDLSLNELYCIDGITSIKYLGLDEANKPKFVLGECITQSNCIDDSVCLNNPDGFTKCLITDMEEYVTCNPDEEITGCNIGRLTDLEQYQCNTNGECVLEGTCVECINDADCGTNQKCAGNECVANTIITDNTGNIGGGSGGGSNGGNPCAFPEDPAACSKQKATTPCVGGKIIYTCQSTCGTSLLFQYDCEGNTASFAAGCNNQIKDLDEEGIDCGGICTVKCPDHCKNNIKDSDETGVDCGGKRCAPCEPVVVKPTEVQEPVVEPEQPPVIQEPKSSFNLLWLSLIPLVIAIGLVVFLLMRKHPPRTESFGKSITKEGVTYRDIPKMKEPNFEDSKLPPLDEPIIKAKSEHFNEQELKDFVKGELHTGKSKDEIVKSLERLGYKPKDVKNIFEEEMHKVIPPKYEKQMRDYILSQLDKGKTPLEIRKLLKKQGWNDKVVDKFLID